MRVRGRRDYEGTVQRDLAVLALKVEERGREPRNVGDL